MKTTQRLLLLGQASLWEWVLDIDDGADLTDRHFTFGGIEQLKRVNQVLRRQVPEGIGPDLLAEDDAAWRVWAENVRCLRSVALRYRPRRGIGASVPGGKPGRPHRPQTDWTTARALTGMTDDEADDRFRWHLDRCRPGPVTLPSGRVVMPNNFHIRRATVVPPTPSEWKDLGVTPRENLDGLKIVRKWWILVFATAAIPRAPVCRRCEARLPKTPTGRRCSKVVCRRCENATYYKKLKRRDHEHLKELWRENKQRIRRG